MKCNKFYSKRLKEGFDNQISKSKAEKLIKEGYRVSLSYCSKKCFNEGLLDWDLDEPIIKKLLKK